MLVINIKKQKHFFNHFVFHFVQSCNGRNVVFSKLDCMMLTKQHCFILSTIQSEIIQDVALVILRNKAFQEELPMINILIIKLSSLSSGNKRTVRIVLYSSLYEYFIFRDKIGQIIIFKHFDFDSGYKIEK